MIQNVEKEQKVAPKGIGLYKINYEMVIKNKNSENNFTAGVLAYSNEEAVKTLADDCIKRIKGFQRLRINEIGYEGPCHALSENVKTAVINGAVKNGIVITKEQHELEIKKIKKEAKKIKKTIIPKK